METKRKDMLSIDRPELPADLSGVSLDSLILWKGQLSQIAISISAQLAAANDRAELHRLPEDELRAARQWRAKGKYALSCTTRELARIKTELSRRALAQEARKGSWWDAVRCFVQVLAADEGLAPLSRHAAASLAELLRPQDARGGGAG